MSSNKKIILIGLLLAISLFIFHQPSDAKPQEIAFQVVLPEDTVLVDYDMYTGGQFSGASLTLYIIMSGKAYKQHLAICKDFGTLDHFDFREDIDVNTVVECDNNLYFPELSSGYLILYKQPNSGPLSKQEIARVPVPNSIKKISVDHFTYEELQQVSADRFYEATSTRLGISLYLPKEVPGVKLLKMFDDGVSNYVDISSGKMVPDPDSFAEISQRKLVPDRKLRIYVLKASTFEELEKSVLKINNEKYSPLGFETECILNNQYNLVDKNNPVTKLDDGRTFPTPCHGFNMNLLHWDQKLGKAYFAWLGNEAIQFNGTIIDGYMLDSIKLF